MHKTGGLALGGGLPLSNRNGGKRRTVGKLEGWKAIFAISLTHTPSSPPRVCPLVEPELEGCGGNFDFTKVQ